MNSPSATLLFTVRLETDFSAKSEDKAMKIGTMTLNCHPAYRLTSSHDARAIINNFYDPLLQLAPSSTQYTFECIADQNRKAKSEVLAITL